MRVNHNYGLERFNSNSSMANITTQTLPCLVQRSHVWYHLGSGYLISSEGKNVFDPTGCQPLSNIKKNESGQDIWSCQTSL